MIKIIKMKEKPTLNFSKFEQGSFNGKIRPLYLQHDAYNVNFIRRDDRVIPRADKQTIVSNKPYVVKISGEILKLTDAQLLSTLIKAYPASFIKKTLSFSRSDDTRDKVYDAYAMLSSFSSLVDDNKDDEYEEWCILIHKDAKEVLSKAFSNTWENIVSDYLCSKIIEMHKHYEYKPKAERMSQKAYWEMYKVLNTNDDSGVQVALVSPKFSGIACLLLADYCYETIFNGESEIDSEFIRGRETMTDRSKAMINVLSGLGKYSVNYSTYHAVNSVLTLAKPRLGFLGLSACNLLEERYMKNNYLSSVSPDYIETALNMRRSVTKRIRDLYLNYAYLNDENNLVMDTYGENFGIATPASISVLSEKIVPENAIEYDSITQNTVDQGRFKFDGIHVDFNNIAIILFSDLSYKLSDLQERYETIKENDLPRDTIKYDIKGLINDIEASRLSCGHKKDDYDFDILMNKCIDLLALIENDEDEAASNIGEAFGVYSEAMIKVPMIVKKGIAEVQWTGESIKNSNGYNFFLGKMHHVFDIIGLGFLWDAQHEIRDVARGTFGKNRRGWEGNSRDTKAQRDKEKADFMSKKGLGPSPSSVSESWTRRVEAMTTFEIVVGANQKDYFVGRGEKVDIVPAGIKVWVIGQMMNKMKPMYKTLSSDNSKDASEARDKLTNVKARIDKALPTIKNEKLRVKLEEFKNELETALKDKPKDDGGFNAKTQKDGSKTGNIVSKTISGNTSTDDNKEQVLAKKSEAFFVLHGLEKIIDEKFTTTDGRVSFLNAFKENYSDVLSEKQMGKIDRVISEVINGKK